jgi:hypothetical protein
MESFSVRVADMMGKRSGIWAIFPNSQPNEKLESHGIALQLFAERKPRSPLTLEREEGSTKDTKGTKKKTQGERPFPKRWIA